MSHFKPIAALAHTARILKSSCPLSLNSVWKVMETLPPKEEIGVTRAVKGVPHAVFIRVIPQRRSALGMSGDALFKGRKTRELSGKKLRHHRSVVRDHQRAESPADRLARCSLNFDTDETFPLSLSRREEDVSESHQVRQLPHSSEVGIPTSSSQKAKRGDPLVAADRPSDGSPTALLSGKSTLTVRGAV